MNQPLRSAIYENLVAQWWHGNKNQSTMSDEYTTELMQQFKDAIAQLESAMPEQSPNEEPMDRAWNACVKEQQAAIKHWKEEMGLL